MARGRRAWPGRIVRVREWVRATPGGLVALALVVGGAVTLVVMMH